MTATLPALDPTPILQMMQACQATMPQPYLLTGVTAILASIGAAAFPIWKVSRTYPQIQIREE